MDPTLSVAIVAAGAALDGPAVQSLAPWWRAAKLDAGRDVAQRAIAEVPAER